MKFTPDASEPNVGIGQTLKHAQAIIDAFARSLADNNCLVQVPIAIFSQAEQYQDRLEELIEATGGVAPQRSDLRSETLDLDIASASQKIDSVPETPTEEKSINSNLKDAARAECLICNIADFPKIDFDQVWNGLFGNIEDFIKDLEKMFELDVPNYCQLARFMSTMCINHLVMLVAVLLACLIKLLAGSFLGSFSLNSFILGIMGSVTGSLLRYMVSVMNFVASPISCIIASLDLVSQSVPSSGEVQKNIDAELRSADQKSKVTNFNDLPASHVDDITADYGNFNKDISFSFEKSSSTISTAFACSYTDVIEDLLGMSTFISCEQKRTGAASAGYGAMVDIVQLISVVSSIIRLKALLLATDGPCTGAGDNRNTRPSDPFNPEQIAIVMQDAFKTSARVAESADGDIAILIENPDDSLDLSPVSFFECNINDMIRNSSLDVILEDAVAIAEENLKGEGLSPLSTTPVRNKLEDIELNGNENILLFDPNRDNINTDILDTINDIISLNAEQVERQQVDFKLPSEQLPDDIDNTSLFTNPNNIGYGEIEQREEEDGILSGLTSDLTNKSSTLKCGSVKNIKDSLDFLNR